MTKTVKMRPLGFMLLLFIQPVLGQGHVIPADTMSADWFAWSKERIAGHEEQGQFHENLALFQEGHRKGYFYFLHPALPALKPYLDLPGFSELMEADRILYDSALEASNTLYSIKLPEDFRQDGSYPLMLIFHGGNSKLQRLEKHWNQKYLDSTCIKAYLQSYRHFDSFSFTWRSGDPRSDIELQQIYGEILDKYPVDTSRILLAGISAGANYATGMALRGILPAHGIIAFCPGLPQVFRQACEPASLHTSFRMYILGGEHDFYLEQQQELMAHLDRLRIPYAYVQVKGMGHQYPEDEGKYLLDGLRFITEQ